jgi:hypothetical protein
LFLAPQKQNLLTFWICLIPFPTFVEIFSYTVYLFFHHNLYFLRPLPLKIFCHLVFPATRERLRMAAAQVGAGVFAAPLPLGLLVVVVLVGLAALVYTKRRTRHKIRRIQEDL